LLHPLGLLAQPRGIGRGGIENRRRLEELELAARGREERGVRVDCIVLDYELKSEYQRSLQEHNRGRADSDGRPDRDASEIRDWAYDHDLKYSDGHVQFPDARIEYQDCHSACV
jgi:hypothetical protein